MAADEGPLGYVRGSHVYTNKRLEWEKAQSIHALEHSNPLHSKGSFRATQFEVASMGYSHGEPITVDQNTLVVADTGGFHRRTPSEKKTVRVELYMSLRRNPFFAGFYPSALGLPYIRSRWAGIAYRTYVWLWRRGTPSWIPSQNPGLWDSEKALLSKK